MGKIGFNIETLKMILPYVAIFVIAIVISGMLRSNIGFLKNSEIKEKEQRIEELQNEKKALEILAKNHQRNSEQYQKRYFQIKELNVGLEKDLDVRNEYITIMKVKLDSLHISVVLSDSILEKIDNEEYEILNNSSNGSINEHKKFFTKQLR